MASVLGRAHPNRCDALEETSSFHSLQTSPSYHRYMTETTPDLTLPGPEVAELRVRMDVLNNVLADPKGGSISRGHSQSQVWSSFSSQGRPAMCRLLHP